MTSGEGKDGGAEDESIQIWWYSLKLSAEVRIQRIPPLCKERARMGQPRTNERRANLASCTGVFAEEVPTLAQRTRKDGAPTRQRTAREPGFVHGGVCRRSPTLAQRTRKDGAATRQRTAREPGFVHGGVCRRSPHPCAKNAQGWGSHESKNGARTWLCARVFFQKNPTRAQGTRKDGAPTRQRTAREPGLVHGCVSRRIPPLRKGHARMGHPRANERRESPEHQAAAKLAN
jgi:hypothetical protein